MLNLLPSQASSGINPPTASTPFFTDVRLPRIIGVLRNQKFKAISFDVFDTLLTRKYWDPTDLFLLMGKRTDVIALMGARNFADIRIACERKLRLRLNELKIDPTLLQIYQEMGLEAGLDDLALQSLMEIEMDLEVASVRPRDAVMTCWKSARAAGKKIIVCTDMYLPQSCIERMLTVCGYEKPDFFFLSCDLGSTKKHGTIFAEITARTGFKPKEILHLGDNKHSDNAMAERSGLSAMHTPMVRDPILQNSRRGLEGLIPDFRRSSELPDFATKSSMKLIAQRLFNKNFDGKFPDLRPDTRVRDFGYMTLGPFVLSLSLWMRRLSKTHRIDTLALLARDGWLPFRVMTLLDDALGATSQLKYLPISRRMIFPWMLHEAGGFDRVAKIGYGSSLLVEDYLRERFGQAGLSVFKDYAGPYSKELLKQFMYDQEAVVYECLRSNLDELKARSLDDRTRVVKFYSYMLADAGKLALFDVGRKGTFQKALSDMLQKDLHGFYVINNYEIHKNAPDRSFASFLGIIDPRVRTNNPDTILYEALLSEQDSGFVRVGMDGQAVRSQNDISENQRAVFKEVHEGALDYVRDAIHDYGQNVTMLEQEPFYASYAMENWSQNESASQILSLLPHEDSVSESTPRSIVDIFNKDQAKSDRRLMFPCKGSRRRIAIYCPSMTSIRGGAERVTALIANALVARGDEVLVLSSGKAEHSISPVYPLDARVFVRNVNVRSTEDITAVIQAYNPDLGGILASGPAVAKVSYAFTALGIRYIISERAEPSHSKAIYWSDYSDDDYQRAHGAADMIALQFPSFARYFRSALQDKIRILPNPIFAHTIDNSTPMVTRPHRIICAARVWFTQKRQDLLLAAFARIADRHPSWRLDFFGHAYGNDATELTARVAELGLADRVSVNPATGDIQSEFANSSIFAIPSAFEGFPNALAEALAQGLAAVGFSGCAGVNELILDGQNGFLVDEAGIEGEADTRERMIANLAGTLDKVLSDAALRERLCANAAESMKPYEATRILESWAQAFDELQSRPVRMDQAKRLATLGKIAQKRAQGSMPEPNNEYKFVAEIDLAIRQIKRSITTLSPLLKIRISVWRHNEGNEADRLLALSQHFGDKLTLPIPSDFDEDSYLRRNSDVADAVSRGKIQSGYMHFLRYGYNEGRPR